MPTHKTKSQPKSASNSEWAERLRYFESRKDALVQTIREFVEVESPSDSKVASDHMGTILANKFGTIGGRATVHRAEEHADNIQIDFAGKPGVKPVLLLGHFDTVYPLGTLANMPCAIKNGRLHGPGVLDMKSGVALAMQAIEGLRSQRSAGRATRLKAMRVVGR